MTVRERFGANLKRERKRAGISQEELAFRAGLHRTEIGMMERATRLPRVDTLVKLAAGIGCTPEVLLDGITWEPLFVRTYGRYAVGDG